MIVTLILIALNWTTPVETCQQGPFILYMSPDGVDTTGGGGTPQTALRTLLGGVEPEIQSQWATEKCDVEVRISSGIYSGQEMSSVSPWTVTDPAYEIKFIGWPTGSPRPVFDGGGSGNQFFVSRVDNRRTNLKLHRLHVRRYTNGIEFKGGGVDVKAPCNRTPKEVTGTYNEVLDCYLYRIGSAWAGVNQSGFYGIGPNNSSCNNFKDNEFVDIANRLWDIAENRTATALVHGIYMSDGATSNTVTRNRFQNCSGSPVKLRNYSNCNCVERNWFIRTGGWGALDLWHQPIECHSWLNFLNENYIDTTWAGTALSACDIQNDLLNQCATCPAEPVPGGSRDPCNDCDSTGGTSIICVDPPDGEVDSLMRIRVEIANILLQQTVCP